MIQDALNTFSGSQAVTAAAASTDVIDLIATRKIAAGRPLFIHVECVTTMTDSGSDSSLAVRLEADDDEAFGSPTNIGTIGTFAAVATAGAELAKYVIPNTVTERYIRVYYTPANGNLSAGAFTAFVTENPLSVNVPAQSAAVKSP